MWCARFAGGLVSVLVAVSSVARADPERAVTTLRHAIDADQQVEQDVHACNTAQRELDANTRLLPIEERRVAVLREAWNRAVAGDHPVEAGRLARAHFVALRDFLAVESALARGRTTLATARATLAADRDKLRVLEARVDQILQPEHVPARER